MKKIITMMVILMVASLLFCVNCFATTNDTLADELYNIGSKYGMTASDKVKIERYLSQYPVTESEANNLVSKANDIAAIMDKAGTTDYSKLNADQKSQVKSIANEAASSIGVTLVFKTASVEIYKNGKLIESATYDNGKLIYTGNNNTAIIVSTIVVLALATGIIARKKLINA